MQSRCPEVLRQSVKAEESSVSDDTTPAVVKTEEKGLSDLVRLCLGRPLDKAQQMSDWERRPLRRQQLVYAGSCRLFSGLFVTECKVKPVMYSSLLTPSSVGLESMSIQYKYNKFDETAC